MQRETRLGPKAAARPGVRNSRKEPNRGGPEAAPTVTLPVGQSAARGLRRLCGLSLEPAALARVGLVRVYVPPGKHWHWQRHSQAGTVPESRG